MARWWHAGHVGMARPGDEATAAERTAPSRRPRAHRAPPRAHAGGATWTLRAVGPLATPADVLAALRALEQAVRRDFERGDIVAVDGWILSRRSCAPRAVRARHPHAMTRRRAEHANADSGRNGAPDERTGLLTPTPLALAVGAFAGMLGGVSGGARGRRWRNALVVWVMAIRGGIAAVAVTTAACAGLAASGAAFCALRERQRRSARRGGGARRAVARGCEAAAGQVLRWLARDRLGLRWGARARACRWARASLGAGRASGATRTTAWRCRGRRARAAGRSTP